VLWDKLTISATESSESARKEMHKLSLTTVLTSQGISFLHAGTEFLRTKYGVENSFNAGDSINRINWDMKTTHKDVFEYVKSLIRMRKDHPAFRMTKAKDIRANLKFIDNLPPGVIAYTLNGEALQDPWKKILVILNGNTNGQPFNLPGSGWKVFVQDNAVVNDNKGLGGMVSLAPSSASILYQD
jgi:pullulanase